MRALNPWRLLAVVAVLALAAGTALASSPSPSPAQSASTSPSGALATGPASAASHSPEASEVPEASDAPEASDQPDAPEAAGAPDSAPSAADIADIVGKLKAAGISTTASAFGSLAAQVGVGGAVRTLAFAHASGKTPAQIVAMFLGGKGWGQIDHELGLSIGPGIGWIMGGGHGQGKPGSP